MAPKTATPLNFKTKLKKINRDLDHLDELLSQIEEQVGLEALEQEIDA